MHFSSRAWRHLHVEIINVLQTGSLCSCNDSRPVTPHEMLAWLHQLVVLKSYGNVRKSCSFNVQLTTSDNNVAWVLFTSLFHVGSCSYKYKSRLQRYSWWDRAPPRVEVRLFSLKVTKRQLFNLTEHMNSEEEMLLFIMVFVILLCWSSTNIWI